MEEDWDNLLILDACRYDLFEECYDADEELKSRISRGSATIGFLKGNFDSKKFHDTIYLTANPQLEWNREQVDTEFFRVIDVWDDEEYWDEGKKTVKPEKLAEKALEVSEKYPNKRLIVHFMQPHYPFLPVDNEDTPDTELDEYFWHQKMRGENPIDGSEAWDLYKNNLKRVLNDIDLLVDSLRGKTVLTSDHGNFVGERASPIPIREWGHPIQIYDDVLIKVPWLELDHDARKEVTEDSPVDSSESSKEQKIKQKLSALGYK